MSGVSPFGVLVPGQPILTDCILQTDETHWTLLLPQAPATLGVFLTNVTGPLAPQSAIGLYMAKASDQLFEYVGYLSAGQPSTLVKTPLPLLDTTTPVSVVLGFCLVPIEHIQNLEGSTMQNPLLPVLPASKAKEAATRYQVAERILEEMYNFIGSYGRLVNPNEPLLLDIPSPEEYILLPSSYVNRWRERMNKMIQKDSSFWQ
ncbi:hypothetical protein AGDE_01151 [Angomonas deanei]|uniref:Hikeshi-like C-terminal domain-containing protein n=1 Tax=Angomonas deanei TaxID=59799 RepID=S9UT33_9TRYP|nr:hypothetical protein AGDE_07995 [Angomonas deanei]EPY42772.1 hypothetical protein AGDE_01151 [Angomonas deanei]CAD2215247.1 Protein of unknown function (DUF775), putative [Angomonas deanei]|eukprot:EPY34097.1 hypothetical protein AGDE_07995 [Angomonas deanei]